jgi:hypothetical protein
VVAVVLIRECLPYAHRNWPLCLSLGVKITAVEFKFIIMVKKTAVKILFFCRLGEEKPSKHWVTYHGELSEEENCLLQIHQLDGKWHPHVPLHDGSPGRSANDVVFAHFVDEYVETWQLGDPLHIKIGKTKKSSISELVQEAMDKFIKCEYDWVLTTKKPFFGLDHSFLHWKIYLEQLLEVIHKNPGELAPELENAVGVLYRRTHTESSSESSEKSEKSVSLKADFNSSSCSSSSSELDSSSSSSSSRDKSPQRK